MSKLEQLIAEFCPNGVEYKKIKDEYTRLKGTPITAEKMKIIANPDGNIRIFAGGKTVITAFEKDIPNANITKVPAVLVQSRGVIDAIYYAQPFTFKNEMWAYTAASETSVKYLYYVRGFVKTSATLWGRRKARNRVGLWGGVLGRLGAVGEQPSQNARLRRLP